MKKNLVIFALFVFLGAISFAGTFENTEAGLSLWVPDDWETTNEQGTLTADAPDGDAFIIFEVLENAEDLETALTVYEAVLDAYFQNYTTEGEPSQYKLNDLAIEGLQGTGTMDGESWGIDVMLIYTGDGVCICISAVADSAGNTYDKTFEDIAASLHKI
jgi:predicted Zn-dependent protease